MKSIIISSILFLVISGHNTVTFSYPANIITTPYGTCTYYYSLGSLNQDGFSGLFNGIIFDSDLSMTFIHYEFAGQATGQFDVPVFTNILNNTALTSNYRLFVQGGYLISTPNISGGNEANALRFQVVDSRSMDILIIHPGWNQPAITVPNLYNQNITLTQTENATINEILNYVSYDSGQIQNIKTDTTMIRNLIINMSGYSSDSNDNIATDMDTLISAINSINNHTKMLNNNPLDMGEINAYSYFSRYGRTYNGDYATFNVEAMTDTGSFDWDLPYTSIRNGYYDNSSYSNNAVLIFYANKTLNSSTIKAYSANDTNASIYLADVTKMPNLRLYVAFINVSNATDYIQYKFLTSCQVIPIYIGMLYNCPYDIQQLCGLSEGDLYTHKLDEVINALQNMNVNVNNLTVNATGITYNVNNTQVNNSVTTYNTDIQNVYNVENDFSTSFNTYNQQFTPDFTETMSTIQSVPSVMNNVVVDLYNLPFIKYPILLTLAGIVLIALLGV